MSGKLKVFILLFGLLLLVAFGGYYYTFHKPHQNTFDVKAKHSVNAEKLFSEFESDEEKANTKYLGNIIEVEGKVVNINKFDGNFEISLNDELEGITCLIDSIYAIQQKEYLSNIKIDDIVKLKGQCNGFLMGVKLDRCVLVK